MRAIRALITVIGAATLALAVASPAGAVEETVGSCMVETIEELGGPEAFEGIVEAGHADGASKEAEEALKDAEDEIEGCLEAPSPILPELNEIIWGGLAFLVLLGVMVRWGFPLVQSTMEARTERIRADLDAAEAAHAEAAKAKQEQLAELADHRANANRLIEEARQEAEKVRNELQARAEADIAEMRRRADAEVAAARERALGDLQNEVNEVVVGAAERVVEQNLDRAAQRQLIDNYIASVGRR